MLDALKNSRSPLSVLNYIIAGDTSDAEIRKGLSTDSKV
jgi:hypothetical protein